jgi:hypothetical protein
MKQLLTFIVSFALNFSFSQTWESLDGGLECTEPSIVSTIIGITHDEALNRIDAFGYFSADRQCNEFLRFGAWTGIDWDNSITTCGSAPHSVLNFGNVKYASGHLVCGTWDNYFYKLQENEWTLVSSVPALLGTSLLAEVNERFYIGAMLDVQEGEEVPMLLEYHPDIDDYTIIAQRVDFSMVKMAEILDYNDTLFIGGKFDCYNSSLPPNRIYCIAKVEDGTIVEVGQGLNQVSNVYSMCVHQDTLFIGGIFGQQNFPGFTNEEYIFLLYYVNGELKPYHIQTNGYVTSLVSHNDILYVGGFFTEANNETCHGVFAVDDSEMIWKNTEQFMSVDGILAEEFSESVYDMLVVDDHLYIAGRFEYIGQDGPYGNIAKLSTPLSQFSNLAERKTDWSLVVYPNPAEETIKVEVPIGAKGTLEIFNNLGQLVRLETINQTKSNISVSHLNAGIYYFTFRTKDAVKSQRVMVR